MISSIANLVYDLPHELPNDFGLRILGNEEMLGKSQIWVGRHSAQSPLQKLNFSNSSQKTCKSRYETFLAPPSLTGFFYFVLNFFVQDCRLSYWERIIQRKLCKHSYWKIVLSINSTIQNCQDKTAGQLYCIDVWIDTSFLSLWKPLKIFSNFMSPVEKIIREKLIFTLFDGFPISKEFRMFLAMVAYLWQKSIFVFSENIFIFNEKYLAFKKIYLYSIKYNCI